MRAICIAFGTVALFTRVAAADSCEDLVSEFAQARGFDAKPPVVETQSASAPAPPATLESRGLADDRLAISEGVAEPAGASAGEAAGMPSAETVGRGDREAPPETVQEQTPAETGAAPTGAAPTGAAATESDAVQQARAETLLLGAMSAAKNDREQECLDLLRQAKELL